MVIREGGYGSHRLALFMPDYFAGVSPIAACEPLKAPENLRNVAFAVHMGEEDNGFGRASYARLWKDKLAELQKQAQNDYIHKGKYDSRKGPSHQSNRPYYLAFAKRKAYLS